MPTTGVVPRLPTVSLRRNSVRMRRRYQTASAKAAIRRFVTLATSAGSYADTEAANAGSHGWLT